MTVRALFTVVLASILTMVLSGAVSAQAPFPKVCNYVQGRVPAAMISDAVANPDGVSGWGELEDPGKPESPHNRPGTWLNIRHTGVPFHPLYNSLRYAAYCAMAPAAVQAPGQDPSVFRARSPVAVSNWLDDYYLIVYEQGPVGDATVFALAVCLDGSARRGPRGHAVSKPIQVSPDNGKSHRRPSVAYDPWQNGYVVVWESDKKIFGVRLTHRLGIGVDGITQLSLAGEEAAYPDVSIGPSGATGRTDPVKVVYKRTTDDEVVLAQFQGGVTGVGMELRRDSLGQGMPDSMGRPRIEYGDSVAVPYHLVAFLAPATPAAIKLWRIEGLAASAPVPGPDYVTSATGCAGRRLYVNGAVEIAFAPHAPGAWAVVWREADEGPPDTMPYLAERALCVAVLHSTALDPVATDFAFIYGSYMILPLGTGDRLPRFVPFVGYSVSGGVTSGSGGFVIAYSDPGVYGSTGAIRYDIIDADDGRWPSPRSWGIGATTGLSDKDYAPFVVVSRKDSQWFRDSPPAPRFKVHPCGETLACGLFVFERKTRASAVRKIETFSPFPDPIDLSP